MRNQFGQVIDCFEVFPTLDLFYGVMQDLLTDRVAMAKLSVWVTDMRYTIRFIGLDFAMFTLYSEGVEFSVTIVGRDYEHLSAGWVQCFVYS